MARLNDESLKRSLIGEAPVDRPFRRYSRGTHGCRSLATFRNRRFADRFVNTGQPGTDPVVRRGMPPWSEPPTTMGSARSGCGDTLSL